MLHTAARDLIDLTPDGQQALNSALDREVSRVLPTLLQDLQEGDEPNAERGSSFLYLLVADSTLLDELRSQISAGMLDGHFTVEDVAARLVGFSYVVGGSGQPSAASFSGGLFTKITGIEARSADHEETRVWTDTS